MAAIQTMKTKVNNNSAIEIAISYQGTPKGTRINITIGLVKGIIENMVGIVPCGSEITVAKPT